MTYVRSDDPVIALQEASALFQSGRYDLIASVDGDVEAAHRVTQVADVFVAWLRRTTSLSLVLVAIREQDTGLPVPNPVEGNPVAVTLDTSQEAVYDILQKDDRGFLTKSQLDLTVSGDNITAEIVETPDPTVPNQLVVKAVQPGAGGTIVLDVPDDDVVAPVSEAFDVVPGGTATLTLGAPVIQEQTP